MSKPALVLQLVPPGVGGVRDFADALALQWQHQGVASPRWALTERAAEVQPLHQGVQNLLAYIDEHSRPAVLPVLVHYSGYGYHPRGLSGWLPRQLAELRRRHAVRITVYFHELHASGPPWQSAFWLGALQARAAQQMAAQADALWTNADAHAAWLAKCLNGPTGMTGMTGLSGRTDLNGVTSLTGRPGQHGAALVVRPVFSTVGEPASPPPLAARPGDAVVFGSEASRLRVAVALRRDSAVLRHCAVSRLIEVGSGAPTLAPIVGLTTHFAGSLGQADVSALLQRCRFSFIDYPAQLLAKSSVFAAYAAHGCAVINLRREDLRPSQTAADGLAAGTHYLPVSAARGSMDGSLDEMVDHARSWYGRHALAVQAVELLQLVST